MLSRFSKKRIVVSSLVIFALAAGGAYAYWTAAGSGSVDGNASAGGTITLSGDIANGVAPGVPAAVTFTATNATTSAIVVGTVDDTLISVDAGHSACLVADFSMAAVPQDQSVAAGGTNVALTDPGSLVMTNTGVNQDACKGATITLTLAST